MALSLEQYRSCGSSDEIKDILTKRNEMHRKRSFGVSIKIDIPEHLIIEILSWLPVKDLLQFKSVCKLWCTIIKSMFFISKHLSNYYDNNDNWRDCLIVQYAISQAGELNVYEFLIDDKENRVLSYNIIDTPRYNTYMCGPCNGIYYLWWGWSYRPEYEHSLWNPALNEYKVLPALPPDSTMVCCYGFGYDSKTNDYKVVIFSFRRVEVFEKSDETHRYSILIYSLRSDSWRYWGDVDNAYYIKQASKDQSYVFVDGCYYWLGSREEFGWDYDEVVISFDITADAYREIPLPKFESKAYYGIQLIVYQESIAFVYTPDDSKSFCVWTLSEEVWSEKFSMKFDFEVWGACTQWRDNMLVFRKARGNLILCDTNTKEIFILDDPQAGRCVNICAYKESLVSIMGFGKATNC